jgi:hypothetical protein
MEIKFSVVARKNPAEPDGEYMYCFTMGRLFSGTAQVENTCARKGI